MLIYTSYKRKQDFSYARVKPWLFRLSPNSYRIENKQDCSYQGEALNVPTGY